MAAIILGWNPDRWNDGDYAAAVAECQEAGQVLDNWAVDRHLSIVPGMECWLFLQPTPGRGLLGHGIVISEPVAPPHSSAEARPKGHIRISFDALHPLGNQVPPAILEAAVPGVPWEHISSSGTMINPVDEPRIRSVWREYGPESVGEPTQQVPGTYPPEAVSRVDVIRYERSPEARRACIAFHGTRCAACGFSFEVAYGEIGRDFIHVHHLVPVSQLGKEYQLDPTTDLVPLCANCHAMAHLGVTTPRTVAELRRIVDTAGFLSGQTVDLRTLDAERDAQRILDQRD
jgi:5-methylcytosine-specific restriction protein A